VGAPTLRAPAGEGKDGGFGKRDERDRSRGRSESYWSIREREINFSDTYFNLFVRKGGKKRKVCTYISYVMNLYKLGPEK